MSTSPDLQQEIIQAEAKVNELREKLRQQKNNESALQNLRNPHER
jgi:hypothetical protein